MNKKLGLLLATLMFLGLAPTAFGANSAAIAWVTNTYTGPTGKAITSITTAAAPATSGGCQLTPTGWQASTTSLGIPGLSFQSAVSGTAPFTCATTGTPTATTNGPQSYAVLNLGTSGGQGAISPIFQINITPNTLVYAQNPAVYTVGVPIGTSTPSIVSTNVTPGAITYAITGGALPPGLSFNSANGAITGTPNASGIGTSVITVTATDNSVNGVGGATYTANGGTTSVNVKITVQAQPDYSNYMFSKTIKINTSGMALTANQLNYPLLVRLANTGAVGTDNFDFSQAQASGADIRFVAMRSNGTSNVPVDLPYQIEEWAPGSGSLGSAVVWVSVDTVYNGSGTNAAGTTNSTQFITMYWGNKTATSNSSGANVFSTYAGYQAVYHMDGNSTGSTGTTGAVEPDVTGNNFHQEPVGSGPTVVPGFIGLARGSFTTANYLRADASSSVAPTGYGTPVSSITGALNFPMYGNYTISTWANPGTGSAVTGAMISKGSQDYQLQSDGGSWENTRIIYTGATAIGGGGAGKPGDLVNNKSSAFSVAASNWHYVVGEGLNGGIFTATSGSNVSSNGTEALYVDNAAVLTTNSPFNNVALWNPYEAVAIGNYPSPGLDQNNANGNWLAANSGAMLDEIQIANVVRSADWVKLNFQTQCNGAVAPSPTTCPATAPVTVPLKSVAVAVSSQPTNLAKQVGSSATFTVATGATTPTYQWYKGTTLISGATSASYNIASVALTDAGSYSCIITSSDGTSSARSNPAMLLVGSAPGAPTAVTGVPGDGQVVVSWEAPASNGGEPITSYTVTPNPSAGTCTYVNGTSEACTGLTDGTPYTFTVTATNSIATGSASTASSAVTPNAGTTAPGAPTAVTGVAGNGQAVVSWTAPASNGGSAITSYTVTPTPSSGATCNYVTGTTETCTGLTNGTSYTFAVTATNGIGTGPSSASSAAVIPVTVPGAPTSVTASVASGQSLVSWTVPASNGGSTITGYTVTSTPGNMSCTATGPVATSCLVTGLTNGQSYTFSVTAASAVGTSASATASATPVGPPTPPATAVSSHGNAQVLVAWTPPVSNGGSPITSYTAYEIATTNNSNQSGWNCTTTGSSCTITGLTNGGSPPGSTIGVIATNANGASAPVIMTDTAASSGTAVPAAPTIGTPVAGNGQVTVAWTNNATSVGPTIVYTATSNPSGLTCQVIGRAVGGAANSCVVTGLSSSQAYTFTVTAANGPGVSAASAASVSVTPSGAAAGPGAPTSVTAVAGNQAASVSWVAPASNGGAAITGYTVTSTPGSFTCSTTTTTSCVVSGLTNGTPYTFAVTATNGTVGAAGTSSSVTPATVPGAPTGVGVTVPTDGQAAVSWTAPSANGSAITLYTVTSSNGPTGFQTCTSNSGTPVTPSCTVTGLSDGTSYTFTVTATNGVGTGAGTISSSITPAANQIGAPGTPAGTPGNAVVALTWAAPSTNTSGFPVTKYIATSNPGGVTCTSTTTGCNVTGLTNGTAYTFTVAAANFTGSGLASSASISNTPVGPPSAPTIGTATVSGIGAVTVTWTDGFNNGSAITSDTAFANQDPTKFCTTNGSTNVCQITGLTVGNVYTFAAKSVNSQGASSNSASTSSVTAATTPATPTVGVSTVSGSGAITVNWTNGSNGNSPVTSDTARSVEDPTKFCVSTGVATSCQVTGLTVSTSYTFKVTSVNLAGASAASSASASLAAATTPTAPTIGTSSVTGSGAITVTWTDNSNGGSPVIADTARAVQDPTKFCVVFNGSTGTCQVTGLTVSTSYTFTVKSLNAAGLSSASSATSSLAAATVPTAPTIGTATITGNGAITVSWTDNANGGSTITGDTARSVEDPTKFCVASGLATSCQVTGLTPSTSYTFKVTTVNAAGASTLSSATSSLAAATVPTAPTIGAATITGNGAVTVTWTDNANGGTAITSDTALAFEDSTKFCTTNGSTNVCQITGLTVGNSYTFVAKSVNAAGASARSSATSSVTAQTAPVVSTGPAAKIRRAGVTTKFGITVTGSTPITYAWVHAHGGVSDTLHKDTTSLLTDSVTTEVLSASDTGSYFAVATNAAGSITSAAATPFHHHFGARQCRGQSGRFRELRRDGRRYGTVHLPVGSYAWRVHGYDFRTDHGFPELAHRRLHGHGFLQVGREQRRRYGDEHLGDLDRERGSDDCVEPCRPIRECRHHGEIRRFRECWNHHAHRLHMGA